MSDLDNTLNVRREASIVKTLYRDEVGNKYHQYVITYEDGSAEYIRQPLFELMTGRHWYDRYMNDLKGSMFATALDKIHTNYVQMAVDRCETAARRAAGIEEENR